MKNFLTINDISKDLYPLNTKLAIKPANGHLQVKSSNNHTISKRTAYRCLNEMKNLYPGKIKSHKIYKNGLITGQRREIPINVYKSYILKYYDNKSAENRDIKSVEGIDKRCTYNQLVNKCLSILYKLHSLEAYIYVIKSDFNTFKNNLKLHKKIPLTIKQQSSHIANIMTMFPFSSNTNMFMMHGLYESNNNGPKYKCTHSKMLNKFIITNLNKGHSIIIWGKLP